VDQPQWQYRVRWLEQSQGLPDVPQNHRYRNERQALEFIAWLRTQKSAVRIVLERREARIGPWTQVDLRRDTR